MTDYLWTAATIDHEAERRTEITNAARVATADQHGFVISAANREEFEDRVAIASERVASVVERLTYDNPGLFPIVHAAVLDGWTADWDQLAAIRQEDQQRRNARRMFFRNQGRAAAKGNPTNEDLAAAAVLLGKYKVGDPITIIGDAGSEMNMIVSQALLPSDFAYEGDVLVPAGSRDYSSIQATFGPGRYSVRVTVFTQAQAMSGNKPGMPFVKTSAAKTASQSISANGRDFEYGYDIDPDWSPRDWDEAGDQPALIVYLYDADTGEVLDSLGGVDVDYELSDHGNINLDAYGEDYVKNMAQEMANGYTQGVQYHGARSTKIAALSCPKCGKDVSTGARIFDHGDKQVLQAKCKSCGWSGSKKRPKTSARHTAITQGEADAILASVTNEANREALEKFVPYTVYGPGYNRGITEAFMDAVRSSNRDDMRGFNLAFSKLEAALDIANGGSNDWYYDSDLGIYTKRLFSSKTAASSGLEAAAAVVAKVWAGEGSAVGTPAKKTLRLIDGPMTATMVEVRSLEGERYYVQDISGQVKVNAHENYRPDPDNPGKYTWDEVKYPKGSYLVWSSYEPLFGLRDLGDGRWQKDDGKVYTASLKTSAWNPTIPQLKNALTPVPSNVGGRECDPRELLRQIGNMNVGAISGGRWLPVQVNKMTVGVSLPISPGYSVNVLLANDDTYTVQRILNGRVLGQQEDVYLDEVGEAAYQASSYKTNDFGGHVVSSKTAGTDWSSGWARKAPSTNPDGGVETWGIRILPDGTVVSLHRGPNNHVRFYDAQGNQHGQEQSNVTQAFAYAEAQGWHDPGSVRNHWNPIGASKTAAGYDPMGAPDGIPTDDMDPFTIEMTCPNCGSVNRSRITRPDQSVYCPSCHAPIDGEHVIVVGKMANWHVVNQETGEVQDDGFDTKAMAEGKTYGEGFGVEYVNEAKPKTASLTSTDEGSLFTTHEAGYEIEIAQIDGRHHWGVYTADEVIGEGHSAKLAVAIGCIEALIEAPLSVKPGTTKVAEFPPKKKDDEKPADEPKSDDAKDESKGEAPPEHQAPPVDQAPQNAKPGVSPAAPGTPQTHNEAAAFDPTTMDVGMSAMMTYHMADGTSGQIEVSFVREENGVYFFQGPTGEFGVGQQNGQWQDADGNSFQFAATSANAQDKPEVPGKPAVPGKPEAPAPESDDQATKKDDDESKPQDSDTKKDDGDHQPPWAKK